ncbi:hypothetical protein OH76DRAFT_1065597 [Lentinus brumalis]|uniref:Secreted protein n=1 Tax=Lentinus brumalis TaxID=2498619 RepID=A0A371DNK8_9APHY|nr:hypothetical protein OH76DRAFT_1065597 [Polyporus brumalis]
MRREWRKRGASSAADLLLLLSSSGLHAQRYHSPTLSWAALGLLCASASPPRMSDITDRLAWKENHAHVRRDVHAYAMLPYSRPRSACDARVLLHPAVSHPHVHSQPYIGSLFTGSVQRALGLFCLGRELLHMTIPMLCIQRRFETLWRNLRLVEE